MSLRNIKICSGHVLKVGALGVKKRDISNKKDEKGYLERKTRLPERKNYSWLSDVMKTNSDTIIIYSFIQSVILFIYLFIYFLLC